MMMCCVSNSCVLLYSVVRIAVYMTGLLYVAAVFVSDYVLRDLSLLLLCTSLMWYHILFIRLCVVIVLASVFFFF